MRRSDFISRSASRGSTLLIAIVLLLLAGVMALLAMNVGVFEQRSSGNDMRAKVVHQAAEGGLAQGFEFLYRANRAWLDDSARWEACGAADTTFPCGAVPDAMRASMFRLKAGAYTVAGLPADLTKFMLPLPSALPAMGAMDVAYGVAPVLCRVPLPLPTVPSAIDCAAGMSNLSDRRVITFVSVAQLRNDDAGRTTLTQTVSRSSLLAQLGGVPAVIATGSVNPTGGGDIVAMPDAAGPGLDISVWSRLSVDTEAGAFGTCSRYDFLKQGGISLNNPAWRDAINNQTTCSKAKQSATGEGWDILDTDGDQGLNKDVKAEEFPCDLFEYAYNVKTWEDTDGDNFCETRLPKIDYEAPNGTVVKLYPDEAFLYKNATKIIGGNTALMKPSQTLTGSLNSASTGLIWCLTDCMKDYNQNAKIGSPEHPVALVLDGSVTFHPTVYGMIFVRDPATTMSKTTGGAAEFKYNSQSAVFGSVLIQGVVPNGSGGGLIFGDRDILLNLAQEPGLDQFDTLHGGWNDRYSY